MEHVFGKDGKGVKALIERVKTSGYGVTQADADAVLKAVQEGTLRSTKLTKPQLTLVSEVVAMQMEQTFDSEDAVNRLVQEKLGLAKQILARVKAFLQTSGKVRPCMRLPTQPRARPPARHLDSTLRAMRVCWEWRCRII